MPFDVDASMLSAAATAIQREYPDIEIAAVCGDFEEHLSEIPDGGRRLFVFLGSTIGNLTAEPRAEFLAALAAVMRPGDSLLLGTDLVKDTGRLVAAYDDAGRRDGTVQPQCTRGHQPGTRRRLRRRRLPARGPLERRTKSGWRCGCALSGRSGCASLHWT